MNQKRYFVYLDILGFSELANELAEKSHLTEDWCRQKILLEPVRNRVRELVKKAIDTSQGISPVEGSDNYLLIFDNLKSTFEAVYELTSIKIPYEGYGFIPLEIGLDAREVDEAIDLDPISRSPVIEHLKSTPFDLYLYHEYCKGTKGIRIKETFVLITSEFFDNLEPSDKKYCQSISYKDKSFYEADLEKIRQRSLVFKFLKEIGCEDDKRYKRIDEIYIPPQEYEDIVNTLREKRLLFITGTAEYGKTYTAVRLMWEFYQQEYQPKWVKGGEPRERNVVRQRLENITADLSSKHIIYFEDPFGKTSYEERETLEREIGTIINNVDRVEDVYVIITSRDEVFKKFVKEKISSKELEEFERTLNIKKPSYDYEKRMEMLNRWAENEDCKWLAKAELKELVLDLIKDIGVLPTPLSIRLFANDSAEIEEEVILRKEIERKSEETAKAFAKEIRDMSDDKKLFLSLTFVADRLTVSFVKEVYQELVLELGLEDAEKFEQVLNWFKDHRISINQERIEFSYPSYSEALQYLLVEDGYMTPLNIKIFSKVLVKLSERGEALGGVSRAVTYHYDRLPQEVRDLLFKFSEKDNGAGAVAQAVAYHYDKLPPETRDLLLKLSDNDKAAGRMLCAIARNYESLPEEVRGILFKLSEKDETAWVVAQTVAREYDKLPEEVRGLLFKLAERNKLALDVAGAIADNYESLPDDVRDLLFKLSEKNEVAVVLALAFTIADYYNSLPDDVRGLLFKLSEKNEAAGPVAVAVAMARNFDELPDNVRGLFFKLLEKDGVTEAVAESVARFYDIHHEEGRNLLFKLSEKDTAAGSVAFAVACNFEKLPEDVRNLLDKLQEPLQQIVVGLSKFGSQQHQESSLYIIAKALPKLNKDFVSNILQELSKSEYKEVRESAKRMLRNNTGEGLSFSGEH